MDIYAMLGVILSIFTIVLVIIGIVLGIRLIQVVNKFDKLVDNVSFKIESLNKIFEFIDMTTDSISLLTDKIVDSTFGFITNLFNRKKKKREDEDYE